MSEKKLTISMLTELKIAALREDLAEAKKGLFVANSKLKMIEENLVWYSEDIIDIDKFIKTIDKIIDCPDDKF